MLLNLSPATLAQLRQPLQAYVERPWRVRWCAICGQHEIEYASPVGWVAIDAERRPAEFRRPT